MGTLVGSREQEYESRLEPHASDRYLQPNDIHVLLVDDEHLSRLVVGNLLRKCNYKGRNETLHRQAWLLGSTRLSNIVGASECVRALQNVSFARFIRQLRWWRVGHRPWKSYGAPSRAHFSSYLRYVGQLVQ